MIEKAPEAKTTDRIAAFLVNPVVRDAIEKVNNDYLYWDKAKYHVPEGVSAEDFWSAVKFSRY